jgi:isoleucyl-tRNA synthetase
MKRSEGKKLYTFYDGPPFATGLPHYGHIAAGTIKDVMTRYATMTGHHCSRRFGWDCHGLPIEYEIDKKYEIKSSLEREEVSKQSKLNKLYRLESKNITGGAEKLS